MKKVLMSILLASFAIFVGFGVSAAPPKEKAVKTTDVVKISQKDIGNIPIQVYLAPITDIGQQVTIANTATRKNAVANFKAIGNKDKSANFSTIYQVAYNPIPELRQKNEAGYITTSMIKASTTDTSPGFNEVNTSGITKDAPQLIKADASDLANK